jgi:micrococcal nuclease
MMPEWHLAHVTKVADGDTVRVTLRLGLGVELPSEAIRLLGIQAPEISGPDRFVGQASRNMLSGLVLNKRIYLHAPNEQRDRYGRLLAWVWLPDGHRLHSINRLMIDSAHAIEYWPRGAPAHVGLPPAEVTFPTLSAFLD